jgi:predicted RNA-binding Zn-ribbon protein involved in translation (DUF1610 family)
MYAEPERAAMIGQCDRCHREAELYEIDDEPGAWLYCGGCAVELIARDRRSRRVRILGMMNGGVRLGE